MNGEASAPPPSNGAAPSATASNSATPSNAVSFPAAPKDGKSAAQSDFPIPLPSQAQAHGAPVRQYLNENLTPYLLEVSKHLAAHRYALLGLHILRCLLIDVLGRPQKPLEFVAEYFMEKSRQIEGTQQ